MSSSTRRRSILSMLSIRSLRLRDLGSTICRRENYKELLCEMGGPLGRLLDFLQVFTQFLRGRYLFKPQLGIP